MSDPNASFLPPSDASLDRALDALRHESETLNAPSHIEAKLMAAFASSSASAHGIRSKKLHANSQRIGLVRMISQWFAPGVAIAASVGMASWMMLSPLSQAGNEARADAVAALAIASEASNPFIALQSLERIALEPTPRLIAANVPRTSLAAYGVPINPETAGQSVRTEMLVAADGLPLAMRFLP